MKKTNITQEMREAAEVQIKELQKQIEYDTKDYTLELLISKFKKGDFFILNCTDAIGVLCECGFLSNPEEEQLLTTEDYLQKIS